MSRYQNSGSQSVARTRRPRRGGRYGAPAWSAAELPGKRGRVVRANGGGPGHTRTVEETTVLVRLPDTPDLERLLRRSPGGACVGAAPADDHVVIVRFPTPRGSLRTGFTVLFRHLADLRHDVLHPRAIDPSGFRPNRSRTCTASSTVPSRSPRSASSSASREAASGSPSVESPGPA
jgi:hypothetical protein